MMIFFFLTGSLKQTFQKNQFAENNHYTQILNMTDTSIRASYKLHLKPHIWAISLQQNSCLPLF